MAKAILNLGFGSGDPAGCPGFRPINPWGRPVPKAERLPPPPPLHQVFVQDATKPNAIAVPIGPKMAKQYCDAFAHAINQQILAGAEKRWSSPIVLKV